MTNTDEARARAAAEAEALHFTKLRALIDGIGNRTLTPNLQAQLDRLTRARDLLIECEQIMMVS